MAVSRDSLLKKAGSSSLPSPEHILLLTLIDRKVLVNLFHHEWPYFPEEFGELLDSLLGFLPPIVVVIIIVIGLIRFGVIARCIILAPCLQ